MTDQNSVQTQQQTATLNLNSIMIGTSQPKALAEFYEKVFGNIYLGMYCDTEQPVNILSPMKQFYTGYTKLLVSIRFGQCPTRLGLRNLF